MKKTFFLGLLLGVAAAVAAAGWYPLVSHVRVPSESGVAQNGGRTESFHIQLPPDRLALAGGAPPADGFLPPDIGFPPEPELAGFEVGLYKLRNRSGEVIGVASRVNGKGDGHVDWTLFLPARGAMFLSAAKTPASPAGIVDGAVPLLGDVVGGSGEFTDLGGSFREEWKLAGENADDRTLGEIEIATLTLRGGR